MRLPVEKRPLCFRVSSKIYHDTFEAIGAASMAWDPRPTGVFHSEEASKVAVDLLFKFAEEMEKLPPPVTCPSLMRPTMDELALVEQKRELWTDKSSRLHDYLRIYEREFEKWRDEPIHLLEIGLNVGASVKLWLQYFTQAKIVGMDIVDFESKVGPFDPARFTFFKGDQFNVNDLRRFSENQPKFEIIIDDGSHASGPIALSFSHLWPRVVPGGYYIVEDLAEVRNPNSHTPGYPNQVEFVKNIADAITVGNPDIDEMLLSKELCILRKKK